MKPDETGTWSKVTSESLACDVSPASHAGVYGNQDCQASKGLDKHVLDGDAGFVDM